jgi:hypothetical protein
MNMENGTVRFQSDGHTQWTEEPRSESLLFQIGYCCIHLGRSCTGFVFGTKFLIARYTPDAWRMTAMPKKV